MTDENDPHTCPVCDQAFPTAIHCIAHANQEHPGWEDDDFDLHAARRPYVEARRRANTEGIRQIGRRPWR